MKDRKFLPLFILGTILPLSCFTFYLIAYYPGMMTVDTFDQWYQIVTLKFNDWHPVIHTLFMYLCTRIWYSPASVSIAQILVITLVFLSGIFVLYKAGVNRILLALTIVFFSLYPTNGYMTVTLWKDILYSYMLLLMTIILIMIFYTNGKWISIRKNQVIFAANALAVMFFRHNGILTFLCVIAVLVLLFSRYYKQWLILGAGILAVYFIISGPLFKTMKVIEAPSTEAFGIPMQQIAAVVKYNGKITDEQKDFISRILPLEVWRDKYQPYITNDLKFDPGFKAFFLMENKVQFLKHWAAIVRQNPRISAVAYLKHTSMIWRVVPYDDSFTFTIYRGVLENDYGIKAITPSTRIKSYADRIFEFTNNQKYFVYFWRPALWLWISFIAGLIIALRINWKALVILVPILSNALAFMIATPSQDYRYQFANVLIAAVLLPLAIQALWKKQAIKAP